jgi:hypothetical protein
VAQKDMIKISKDDLVAAWMVLENLAVSFDQIGAAFTGAKRHELAQQRALQEALMAYLTPTLVQTINEARVRLGQYLADEEAEALSEQIVYWDYASSSKGMGEDLP